MTLSQLVPLILFGLITGVFIMLGLWLGHGIYINWHISYRCADCGHREHERGRRFWRICPRCGSEASDTITEKGRQTLFGWQNYHTEKEPKP